MNWVVAIIDSWLMMTRGEGDDGYNKENAEGDPNVPKSTDE
jgi:hypothetical protein